MALLVYAEAALAVPRFTSNPVTTVNEDASYRYDIRTTDNQSGSLQVSVLSGPSWLALSNIDLDDGDARLSGTPNQSHVGAHAVSLQVRNLRTNSTAVQNFSVVVANVNDAPVITGQTPNPIPLQQGTALTIAFTHLAVTDVDNAYPTGFTLTVLNGSNYSRNGNTITPSSGFVGMLTVPVRVNDGGANSNTFNLRVNVAQTSRTDLSLSIAAAPAPALVAAEVEWRLTIANAGPQASGAAELTAELAGNPFALTSLSSCSVTPVADRQRVVCSVAAIPAGASTTITLRGAAAQGGDVFVTGSVRLLGTATDPNAGNDSAEAALHVAEALGAAAQELPSPDTTGVGAGDVNGDGFADVVLAKAAGGAAAELYLNVVDGDATRRRLAAPPLAIGDSAASNLLLVDLDQNASLDLVTTSASGGSNIVYRNDGTGAFSRAATLAGGATYAVAAADFDGDGAHDLAFANRGANTVFLNRGASGFSRTADLGNDDSRGVVAFDFDVDGLPDLVFANAGGASRYYRNLGAGNFAAGVAIETAGAESVAAGDFNGDGRPDLVFGARTAAQGGPPTNPVFQNNPGVAGSPLFVLTRRLGAAPTTRVLAADVDGDGALDVITLNATGTHQLYRGDAAGGFMLHRVQFTWDDAVGGALGKLSVDTAVDLAVAGAASSGVFLNDGRGGLGRGDTTVPIIQLLGSRAVDVIVGETYADPGATATDDVDGNLTPRIAVTNPVNTAIVGTYTVRYDVRDSSGNAAVQATREVRVVAREGMGGGGGGATHALIVAVLALLAVMRARRRG